MKFIFTLRCDLRGKWLQMKSLDFSENPISNEIQNKALYLCNQIKVIKKDLLATQCIMLIKWVYNDRTA